MPFKIKKTVSNITIIGNSVYFNGSNQYLSVANTGLFGSGNWTFECWINAPVGQTDKPIIETRNSAGGVGSSTGFTVTMITPTEIRLWCESQRIRATANYVNQWLHIAVVKNSTTTTMYFNGVSVGTTTLGDMSDTSFIVGAGYYGEAYINTYGNFYTSNMRVVKGSAVYTSNFTPPTSPLTAISNTVLLTCNAATIIDGSTNNFTITNNNAATVSSAVTPFSSTFLPFKIKKNDVNLTSGFKLKHVSYVRPVYDFTISPAYSGKSTWDLTADGPLILSTSGSWIITPANLINTKIKMWGGGGASFKAAWKGGGGGFSSGSVQLEPGVPYRIVTSMNGSNGTIGSGGLTGIFSSSISQANSIMIAGGGGIGTDYIGAYGGDGGAGGGSSGQDGTGNGLQNGRGGTQIAGGSPAIYNGVPAGSALQANGGDGGAGYWGGGAQNAAGSGGGSGYIHPTKVVNGTTVTGASSTPANSSDSERSGSAQGSLGNTPGSMGIIIIRAA